MSRIPLLISAVVLLTTSNGIFPVFAAVDAECDRECLTEFITQYLDAMIENDPESLPVSDDVRFTEDCEEMELGEGLWESITDLDSYRLDILDVRYGGAFSFLVVREGSTQILLALRLKIRENLITEIETMVVRGRSEGLGFTWENLSTPDERMTKVPDESVRNTRKELIEIGQLYPAGLRAGSFDSVDVPFVPNVCYRRENGMGTAGVGCITGNGCENMLTQRFPYMPDVFDRLAIVDEELGIVLIRMNFRTNSISSENSQYLEVYEAFKIYNDSMYAVEAFMQVVPATTANTSIELFGWEFEDITGEGITPAERGVPAERKQQTVTLTATTRGISIPLEADYDDITLKLYDMRGRQLYSLPMRRHTGPGVYVPLTGLVPGLYHGRLLYSSENGISKENHFNLLTP